MDWSLIIKEVVGWAIPLILTGAVAYYVAPLRSALKKGQAVTSQEEWDSHSQGLCKRITKLEEASKSQGKKIDTVIRTLNENQRKTEEHFKASDANNIEAFIQIYQRDLIVDGKEYLYIQKYITPAQLANYEKRFKKYKEWGGNGDVDPWITLIRKLPVKMPDQYE